MTPSGVEQVFDKLGETAEPDETIQVAPHILRHSFARTWLVRGGDVYSLSRLMGHSSVKITEIYLEDFKSRQARERHSQFSPLGKLRVRQRGRGCHIYNRTPSGGGSKPRDQGTEGKETKRTPDTDKQADG